MRPAGPSPVSGAGLTSEHDPLITPHPGIPAQRQAGDTRPRAHGSGTRRPAGRDPLAGTSSAPARCWPTQAPSQPRPPAHRRSPPPVQQCLGYGVWLLRDTYRDARCLAHGHGHRAGYRRATQSAARRPFVEQQLDQGTASAEPTKDGTWSSDDIATTSGPAAHRQIGRAHV